MMNDVKNSNPTQNEFRSVLKEHFDNFINLYIFTEWFPNYHSTEAISSIMKKVEMVNLKTDLHFQM